MVAEDDDDDDDSGDDEVSLHFSFLSKFHQCFQCEQSSSTHTSCFQEVNGDVDSEDDDDEDDDEEDDGESQCTVDLIVGFLS